MEKIQFDSGMKEYRINGKGVLRFNPADPNLYARFMEAVEKIDTVEKELATQAQAVQQDDQGQAALALLCKADRKMKELLSWVFGEGNDFEQILQGINLLAVAGNGQRVVNNLFQALQPVLVEGAQSCTRQAVQSAVRKAQARRAAQ